MTPEQVAGNARLHYVLTVRLVHSVLATVGLLVIVGFVIVSVADAWVTLLIVVGIAIAAGFLTSVVVPRDQREQWLRRLGR